MVRVRAISYEWTNTPQYLMPMTADILLLPSTHVAQGPTKLHGRPHRDCQAALVAARFQQRGVQSFPATVRV